MKLTNFLFYDKSDDTETSVRCESFDTALILFCKSFDLFYIVESIAEGIPDEYGFPTVHIQGYSTLEKG